MTDYAIQFLDNSWGNADIVSVTPQSGNFADAKANIALAFENFVTTVRAAPNLMDYVWEALPNTEGFTIEYQLAGSEFVHSYAVVLATTNHKENAS